MSKAGPLTRSRSKRAKAKEAAAGTNDGVNPSHGPSLEVKASQARGDGSHDLYSDEIVIGLALGSPGKSPLPPLPLDDRDVDVSQNVEISYSCTSSENPAGGLGNVCEIGPGQVGAKRKGSKWKTLGNLFGRKDAATQAHEPLPFYQLDRVPEQGLAKPDRTQDHPESNALRRKRADSSRSKETRTEPSQSTYKENSNGLLRRNSSRRKGLRRRKVEDMRPETLRLHNALSVHAEVESLHPPSIILQRPKASLLQVEIPNIELERYSVMFGDVLEARLEQKPQSSLLARKRSALTGIGVTDESKEDNYQLLNSDMVKTPHRRGDSGSSKSSKTPSFSLFPSSTRPPACNPSPGANKAPPKPSPLSRSTTAPNTLAPPDRPKLHTSKSEDQEHVFVIVPTDTPSTTTSSGRKLSSNQSYPSINSTQTSFFECPAIPVYKYPTLELDPINPNSKDGKEVFLQRAFPTRKSSMKKLQLPLDKSESHDHHQTESVSTTAAEVSIARQISISRKQRQLLVPIAPKLARQPRQPTINGVSTPAARKSHHLTYEED